MKQQRFFSLLIVTLLLSGLVLAGCSSGTNEVVHQYHMAPLEDIPHDVQNAPVRTQEAYQFAVANQEIADALTIVIGTVKSHVYNICQKLHAANRTQAIARARDIGIL